MASHQLQPLDPDVAREPTTNSRGRMLAAALALVTAVLGWALGHALGDEPAQPPPRPLTTAADTRATSSTTTPRTLAERTATVTWQDVAGLAVPVSAEGGPRETGSGRASGFARTDLGAAFAAVHLMVRTFPFAGSAVFEPTIAAQVVGRDAAALARLTRQAYDPVAKASGVRDGGPLRSEGGYIAGYQLDRGPTPTSERGSDRGTSGTTRTVRVLVRQAGYLEAARFTEYRVRLTWQDNDWRLVAPAWGDWRNAAVAVPNADPSRYRSYDEAGTR